MQFGKRLQKYEETVEEYAAELKRLYDKAYPGRNPEMRRQLLLQQFLNGLRNKEAKFAVEYYKEPNSIEDAVHHVVTYTEAQQGPKAESYRHHNYHSKAVSFEDGDDDDFDNAPRARSISPSPSHRKRQTLRKVQNTPSNTIKEQSPTANTDEKEILQKILSCVENSSNDLHPNKLPLPQDKRGQGQSQNYQSRSYSQDRRGQGFVQDQGQFSNYPSQGQGQNPSQGQNQGRYANLQCFYCLERGHIKVNCPVLKAERNQGILTYQNRSQKTLPVVPSFCPPHGRVNNIDLN